MDLNVASNCWICEGWSPIEFTISLEDVEKAMGKKMINRKLSGSVINSDDEFPFVNLHLNFDGYKAHLMNEVFDEATGEQF